MSKEVLQQALACLEVWRDARTFTARLDAHQLGDIGIESLRAELAKPDGWLPIESAPKDGTALMLYTSEGVIEGAFSYGCWEQSPCYATYDGCGGVALHSQPTHWMPLPATPSAPE